MSGADANVTLPIAATGRQMTAQVFRSPVSLAIVSGFLIGVGYVASPLSVWFLLAMAALFAWAGRGLSARERRWVWALLAVAAALRVAAVAVLFVTTDHHRVVSFFWDGDGMYMKQRSLWIRNLSLGVPVPPLYVTNAFYSYGWTTYILVLAYLQYLVGPAPYGVHLFNVALCMATAVMLYRLIRSAFGRVAALLGFALLLFLPTPFLWSVSALKESLFVFLEAVALTAAVAVIRSHRLLVRALALLILGLSVASIDGVRVGGQVIVLLGLAVGFAASIMVRRVVFVALVVLLLPFAVVRVSHSPNVQTRIMTQLKSSALMHIGNVRTEGHGYKLLEQRFYSGTNDLLSTMTPIEGARFVVRALISFVIVPLPWQLQSWSEMAYLPQQILWYVLVALAFVGLFAGLKRDMLVTCLLAGLTVVGGAVIAINSGNIGTMVRHRDTVVPFVLWLSALGAVAVVSRIGEQWEAA